MSSYRLWPSTDGPSSPVGYSGSFISGLMFSVAGGGNWFEGYWWWVCADANGSYTQSTAPVKCALWSVVYGSEGFESSQVVPGSVVTSGTLTAGAWNWIPLETPLQLAPGYDANYTPDGSAYVAAIGCNGSFPDTGDSFGTGDPYADGLNSGPIYAYGQSSSGPYSINGSGVYTIGGDDPSTTIPLDVDSNFDNFWVDVQVSDTAPASYTGSYRLWPNKYDSNDPTSGDSSSVNYTVATEIHLTAPCTLNNVWYFSPSGAETLATRADVWDINTGDSAASITTPNWLTPSGSAGAAASGWLSAAFAEGVTLPAGSYRVSVYNAEGTTDANWNAKDQDSDYWGQTYPGVGANGITWGPVYAPSWSDASAGYLYGGPDTATPEYSDGSIAHVQPVFGMLSDGDVDFPQLYSPVGDDDNQSQNYWIDLEVTPITEYSWFIGANGGIGNVYPPLGTPGTFSSFGDIQLSLVFKVTEPGYEVAGYYYYWDSANTFTPYDMCLWQVETASSGTVVPGSDVTCPAPTATGWQYVALPTPLTLTVNASYKLALAATGGFYWLTNVFDNGTTAAGYTNGPLTLFSDATVSGGANPDPLGSAQGTYGEATTTTATSNYPSANYSSGAPGIDILVQAATPEITIVQTAAAHGPAYESASDTIIFDSPVTAGNCIVVIYGVQDYGGSGTASSNVESITIGGSADNFGQVFATTKASGDGLHEYWADPNCAGGGIELELTINSTTGASWGWIAYEVSGLPSTIDALLDQSISFQTFEAGDDTWSSGTTGTTAQANELWLGCYDSGWNVESPTITGPASWTNVQLNIAQTGGNYTYFLFGDYVASAEGDAGFNGTQNFATGENYVASAITLKSGSSSPAITIVQTAEVDGFTDTAAFADGVTEGNFIVVVSAAYSAGEGNFTQNGVEIGGTANPAGSTELLLIGSPGASNTVGSVAWIVPVTEDLAGATSVACGLNWDDSGGPVGVVAYEVSSPTGELYLDQSASGNGDNDANSSGTTAAITSEPELVVGWSVGYSQDIELPSGYANTDGSGGAQYFLVGYQIVAEPGGTYSYGNGASSDANWAAGIITLMTTSASPPPPSSSGLLLAIGP